MVFLVLVFLSVIFCPAFVHSTGYNANENVYAFRVFENFEATKDIFLRERLLVQKLIETRNKLQEELTNFRQLAQFEQASIPNEVSDINSKAEFNGLDPLKALQLLKWSAINLTSIKQSVKHKLDEKPKLKAYIVNLTSEYPNLEDFRSASRAFVFVQDAYQFNLTSTTKGIIDYQTSHGENRQLEGKENLGFDDMFSLAETSYILNLYSNCIEYLRVGLAIAPKKLNNKEYQKGVDQMKNNVIQFNNNYLTKRNVYIGANFKVLSYLVDNDLSRKKKQPKVIREGKLGIDTNSDFFLDNYYRDLCGNGGPLFSPRSAIDHALNCRMIHHNNPYLKLGPYKVEVVSESPYISIVHDFLTETEINFMVEYSVPRLSRTRQYGTDNSDILSKHETKSGKKVRIVHKTVQCWIEESDHFKGISKEAMKVFDDGEALDLDTVTGKNRTIIFPIMENLAKKIEKATMMKVTPKYSATPFQTTNYGLGGLCEIHMDPHGYIEGKDTPPSRINLKMTGDMVATTMAWLDDVEAGGATAFTTTTVERLVMPRRGSMAFWYSLDKKGHRDSRSSHGGCPVLKGSKWIVNKWIYYFNQFQNFPCSTNPNDYMESPKGYYRSITTKPTAF